MCIVYQQLPKKMVIWRIFSVIFLCFFTVQPSEGSVRLDHHFGEGKPDEKAFLGGDMEPNELENMDSEVAKTRLGLIFDKIDTDENKKISETELKDWIILTQNRYIFDNTENLFEDHDLNKDKLISWPEYEKASQKLGAVTIEGTDSTIDMSKGTEKDRRKFAKADVNSDGVCTRDEFQSFLHPEQFVNMRSYLLEDALLDYDTNKDGFIEMEEYLNGVFSLYNFEKNEEWVEKEREQFRDFLDQNKDGKLDSNEILEWVAPDSSEQALDEAKQLIPVVDEDQDGFVSKDEMLKHLETFMGSHVTDFGELLRRHDEL